MVVLSLSGDVAVSTAIHTAESQPKRSKTLLFSLLYKYNLSSDTDDNVGSLTQRSLGSLGVALLLRLRLLGLLFTC